MRTLFGPSFVLEPQSLEHAAEMFEVLSDPAIYEFENQPPSSKKSLAERYVRLEARSSPDGRERWLNWVIRLATGQLAGYVQGTVLPGGRALIAYELNSKYWRQGLGSAALRQLMNELGETYDVCSCAAVLKSANYRSLALLRKLGFETAARGESTQFCTAQDEVAMVKLIC